VSSTREVLCDLVETRSAQYSIPRRKLWSWAFTAILDSILIPDSPGDASLDTEFGIGVAWRRKITDALSALERQSTDPSKWNWTGALVFSSAAFDTWLKGALRDNKFPPRSKRRAGAKSSRDKLAAFIANKYPNDVPPGVTYKEIAKQAKGAVGKIVHERTVRRALGHK